MLLKEMENNIQLYLDELEANFQKEVKRVFSDIENVKPQYTQMWLARKVKLSKQAVSRYCLNEIQPKYAMMCVIAEVLGVEDVRKMYKTEGK